ncbi:unnamed protein product (macronuclear) [Paramecium tetraurelia]|uniref:Uncharacterized protein n=1 Tax=Paramecium tetraurelia TaxID=5888 RepID=A0BBZ7_PARTE|nr:uncharacterized protein GSPATT00000500001 [Paramecium tetraurelia]CAK56064.1 unnamed protein product [Paramecium tetraurelia]|eukprot:XP_001423462.1 hypothetical protein (macronuclear) [Paramecium tetraurelia strain d4-2]
MIIVNNTPKRQKTQDSDLIDSLIIVEDSSFKENQVEYQNNVKLRNVELQQLRQKNTKNQTLLIPSQTQSQQQQQICSKRGSLAELHSNLPFSQTYLGQMQNRKKREPPTLRLNELQQMRRYESLENLVQQPTNRNYLKTQNDYTSRNKDNFYFNAQQVQIQQLIKTLGSRRY